MRRYEGDATESYAEKHGKEFEFADAGDRAAREMARIRRANEVIAESREYTAEEKRRLIREHNAMIKEIAKGIRQQVEP